MFRKFGFGVWAMLASAMVLADESMDVTVPIEAEALSIAGLKADVEIVKDEWGVSHIYAQNQHDLFFAQGYNAARDRLFQFEMWRRRAIGTLAEIQGEKAIDHDEGARLLRYRGELEAELNHYHDDGAEIVRAFVAGVNSYIDWVRANPNQLPPEFKALGLRPEHWTPEVVISRHNALTGGISTEVLLAESISALGAEVTEQILPFERKSKLKAIPGIDLSLVTSEVMHRYRASRTQPPFDRTDIRTMQTGAFSPLDQIESLGSNNWVIAGEHTASGKPIMANDPHRSLQIPSLRYIVHLNAPGWNVIGAGEPALPGISIGHNEHGAWGLTIFRIDQEDLYVYKTNPDNPDQYWYEGAWKDMELESAVIKVKGGEAVTRQLRYTVHGPVIHEIESEQIAYGLKAAWLAQGAAPYLASLRMDQADSWESFRAACEFSGLPGENMVWADNSGQIGWQSVGYTPVRFGWDGRLPVPGDGTYEWQGFVPIRSMPHIVNPEAGWYGTANENNVPEHYPNIFADFYSDPARARRLQQVFGEIDGHTVADSKALQYDNHSTTAESVVPIILRAGHGDEVREAVSLLAAWDFKMDRDSAAALIYDKWELGVLAALNEQVLPGQRALITRVKLRDWMLKPPSFLFGNEPEKGRDTMIRAGLEIAYGSIRAMFGKDPAKWQYGAQHVAHIKHPLGHLGQRSWDVGPLGRGGASNTLNANRGDAEQISGGSFRMIVDTADWDSAVATNTPGQSGDPNNPFYRNLFKGWNEGDYFPLYFSREKIEMHAAERLLLQSQGEYQMGEE